MDVANQLSLQENVQKPLVYEQFRQAMFEFDFWYLHDHYPSLSVCLLEVMYCLYRIESVDL